MQTNPNRQRIERTRFPLAPVREGRRPDYREERRMVAAMREPERAEGADDAPTR